MMREDLGKFRLWRFAGEHVSLLEREREREEERTEDVAEIEADD